VWKLVTVHALKSDTRTTYGLVQLLLEVLLRTPLLIASPGHFRTIPMGVSESVSCPRIGQWTQKIRDKRKRRDEKKLTLRANALPGRGRACLIAKTCDVADKYVAIDWPDFPRLIPWLLGGADRSRRHDPNLDRLDQPKSGTNFDRHGLRTTPTRKTDISSGQLDEHLGDLSVLLYLDHPPGLTPLQPFSRHGHLGLSLSDRHFTPAQTWLFDSPPPGFAGPPLLQRL